MIQGVSEKMLGVVAVILDSVSNRINMQLIWG